MISSLFKNRGNQMILLDAFVSMSNVHWWRRNVAWRSESTAIHFSSNCLFWLDRSQISYFRNKRESNSNVCTTISEQLMTSFLFGPLSLPSPPGKCREPLARCFIQVYKYEYINISVCLCTNDKSTPNLHSTPMTLSYLHSTSDNYN